MQKTGHTLGWIFCALIVGTCLGIFFPALGVKLIPISAWVLQLIKAAATPLIFLAIIEAILCFKVSGRDFIKLFCITSLNAGLAVAVGLLVAHFFKPGLYIKFLGTGTQEALGRVDLLGILRQKFPLECYSAFCRK